MNWLKVSWGFAKNYRSKLLAMRGERTWSQEGEDRLLWRYFCGRRSGFYVDIGAHHPYRFSNTYLFYKAGWTGINIDAAPGSMRTFKRWRRRDINLEVGVSEEDGFAKFYIFNEPALNTFHKETAELHSTPSWNIKSVVDIPTIPLRDILNEHCNKNQKIDFMSVDVEGYDVSVLRSNNWELYRPKIVLAESLYSSLGDLEKDPCAQLLKEAGYTIYAKTGNTVLYIDKSRAGQSS